MSKFDQTLYKFFVRDRPYRPFLCEKKCLSALPSAMTTNCGLSNLNMFKIIIIFLVLDHSTTDI